MCCFIKTLVAGGIFAVFAMGAPSTTLAQPQPWLRAESKFNGEAFNGGAAYRSGRGGQYRSYRSYSYAPAQTDVPRSFSYAPAPTFQPGDEVVFTAERAKLMVGHQTVGTATAGQRLKVLKVEGPWVGTQIDVAGNLVGGWIRNELVTTAPNVQR